MKIILKSCIIALLCIMLAGIAGCGTFESDYIDPSGNTIATRFIPPEGYTRTTTDDYGEYIRSIGVLEHGSRILKYDGTAIMTKYDHAAVLDIDLDARDLQQCADSILRVRCEYLWSIGDYDSINYHLTSGDEFPYSMYRQGYRLFVEDGTKVALEKTAEFDDSYECFRDYLLRLFTYAGTISIESESMIVEPENMQIGDILVFGGSPGHAMMITDMCQNSEGDVLFLLSQGNTPAQQMHVLTSGTAFSPWFSLDDMVFPFTVGGFTFPEGSLRRLP